MESEDKQQNGQQTGCKDITRGVLVKGIFSDCWKVGSGFPQGSALGSLSFTIYTKNMELGSKIIVSKFTNQSKLRMRMSRVEEYNSTQ